jgi:hypothetical protein
VNNEATLKTTGNSEVTSGKPISSLILEVASIVLAVLLALAVGEWQQDRERDELAITALQNVLNELQANSEILGTIHENNDATITAAKAEEDGNAGDTRQFVPGVQVRATAWQALLSSGASNYIDYQLLLTLSKTYSQQSVYVELGMKLMDASLNIAALNTANKSKTDQTHFQAEFMAFFEMTLAMETSLSETYGQAQTAIEQTLH